MGATREVAEIVADLKFIDLTPHLIERTEDHILDQLGIQIGVLRKLWLKLEVDYVLGQGNKPDARIACFPDKVMGENAAIRQWHLWA